MRTALRSGWFCVETDRNYDLDASGIYEWRIESVGVYVGKAKKLRSRINAYPNHVRRMIAGLAWHGDPTRDYRPIHYALQRAYDEGLPTSVVVLL